MPVSLHASRQYYRNSPKAEQINSDPGILCQVPFLSQPPQLPGNPVLAPHQSILGGIDPHSFLNLDYVLLLVLNHILNQH